MPKGKGPDHAGSPTQQELPQGTPRDLYPTSDIRFVMLEVGKLTANVERLISDVKSQGTKIDEIRHQASYIKGGIAAATAVITVIVTVAGFILSSRWDSAVDALRVVVSAPSAPRIAVPASQPTPPVK